MDLNELRNKIDLIDDDMIHLFVQRMEIAAQIAEYKREHSLPILMPERELHKLQDVAEKAGPEMAGYATRLYSFLFELSRDYQSKHTEVV